MKFYNLECFRFFIKIKYMWNAKSKYSSRFFNIFWHEMSFISKYKSMQNIQNQHLRKLVQAKILWHKCSEEVKKLVCIPSFVAQITVWKMFYYFLTLTSMLLVRKGMQAKTLFMIHLAGLYIGAILNSIARKILPTDWNQFFSSKKNLV